MTIAIVTAQGHGVTGRRKACTRGSAEGKGATWSATAHEFVSRRAGWCASAEDQPRPAGNLDVRDDRYPAPIYASLVKGEGVELP